MPFPYATIRRFHRDSALKDIENSSLSEEEKEVAKKKVMKRDRIDEFLALTVIPFSLAVGLILSFFQ